MVAVVVDIVLLFALRGVSISFLYDNSRLLHDRGDLETPHLQTPGYIFSSERSFQRFRQTGSAVRGFPVLFDAWTGETIKSDAQHRRYADEDSKHFKQIQPAARRAVFVEFGGWGCQFSFVSVTGKG